MSNIKMIGPQDAAPTLSFDGQTYSANKKGVFTVPVEAYEGLKLHGFISIGDKDAADAAAEEAQLQAEADAAAEQERVAAEQKAADEAEQERLASEAAANASKSAQP